MLPIPEGPATNLEQLTKTLRPEPLIKAQEFQRFYRPDMNAVRGEDTVLTLADLLKQSYRALPYRAFVMGHAGVGKSTEITRLLEEVKDRQIGVRLSVATELNPASFKVFDVVMLMMIRLAEEAKERGALPLLSEQSVSKIERLFDTEETKQSSSRDSAVSAEAGAGVKDGSGLAGLFGLFASTKAEIKFSAERKSETKEYRFRRHLPDLVEACNQLIDACNESLFAKEEREWILVIEDLEKMGISPEQLKELFIQYGTVFTSLNVNMIFTIPIWIAYSQEAERLPLQKHMVYDTPVYKQDHSTHEDGQKAVRQVLEARVSPTLFAKGQMQRLIVASGGNLRDLFALVQDAGGAARRRTHGEKVIGDEDVARSINKMRRDYRMKLGNSPYDQHSISDEDKTKRLISVYGNESGNKTPDPVLYALLRARALQEFNGQYWFGVHPLVVDILKSDKHLNDDAPGGSY